MQMVTLNKDDIYQGPLVLVNHNYPIANNYQITNCSTAKDSTISLEKTAMEMLTKAGIFAMLGLFMQKLWKKISGVLKNIIYI